MVKISAHGWRSAGESEKKGFSALAAVLAVAWVAAVVGLHYLFSYLLDARYSSVITRFLSKIFGG